MRRKSYTPPRDIPAETQAFAEQLATKVGAKPEEFRYAEYRYHNRRHWTVRAGWEQLVGDDWIEVSAEFMRISSAALTRNSLHFFRMAR